MRALLAIVAMLAATAVQAQECYPSATKACEYTWTLSWDNNPAYDANTKFNYQWRIEGKGFSAKQATKEVRAEFKQAIKVGEKLQCRVQACNAADCSDWAWISLVFKGLPPPTPSNLALRRKQ